MKSDKEVIIHWNTWEEVGDDNDYPIKVHGGQSSPSVAADQRRAPAVTTFSYY